jgi:hypothetical protein
VKIAPDSTPTGEREEPIAADARPEGDGKPMALWRMASTGNSTPAAPASAASWAKALTMVCVFQSQKAVLAGNLTRHFRPARLSVVRYMASGRTASQRGTIEA